MQKNFLVTFLLAHLGSCALKYKMMLPVDLSGTDEQILFNDIEINRVLYVSPRIFVVGVLLHEDEMGQNVRPIDTAALFLDKDFNIADKAYKGPKSQLRLPTYEVEIGREPLELLLNNLYTKLGITAWPTKSVGIGNQYGYSYIPAENLGDVVNYGSSVTHMNPVLQINNIEYGCYLGSFFGTADSRPDPSMFIKAPNSMAKQMWMNTPAKQNPVIYVGYTVATDFNKIDPKLLAGAKPPFQRVDMLEFSTSIGSKSATKDASPSQAFLRMALMLDNLKDDVVKKANHMMDQIRTKKMKGGDGNSGNVVPSMIVAQMERIRI